METPTAPERAPKRRQKNCNSCVQGKRRCDRRTPVCSRCADKKITCIYGKTRLPGRQPEGFADGPALESNTTYDLDEPSEDTFNPLTLDFGFGPIVPPESILDTCFDGTFSTADAFDASMSAGTSLFPNRDQWLVPTEHHDVLERPGTPVDEEIIRSYEKMAPICDGIQPWHLYDPTTLLHYIVSRVKNFVSDMATTNATPFLHRHLYRDHTPACILSCFSTSVLYTNRTPATTGMVMRAIDRAVKDLLAAETGGGGGATMPVEKLARTQALFLFQIIRLLDGDVTLRAQGERDIRLLEFWLNDLCKVRENLGDLGASTSERDLVRRKQHPPQWETWIFAESVRRTIVMAHSFVQLYEMMKDIGSASSPNSTEEDEDRGVWNYTHRWTLSRHLWEAKSSIEFERAWKENPHFIITNYAFNHFLQVGRGDDVDELAEILLSVYMGVEETKEFITSKT